MKARQPHVVALSDRAIEILEGQRGISTRYVFPSVRGEGAKAALREWCGENEIEPADPGAAPSSG
jgi:integrase